MAFFKFRKDGEEHAAPPSAPESIETLRKRARYRLAGAAVLVLAGVIGFPLLFDSQPRPIAVDIPIVIPDRDQAAALPANPASQPAVAPVAQSSGAVADVSLPPVPAPAASRAAVPAGTAPVASAARQVKAPAVAAASPSAPPTAADGKAAAVTAAARPPAGKSAAATLPAGNDGARAQALLEGKADHAAASAAADTGRFVVQFGSYSDVAKAHEARLKVERSGFKTYAQVVQGSDGKRYRVRVGPFAHRAEAEKAAEKIKKLDLPATILGL